MTSVTSRHSSASNGLSRRRTRTSKKSRYGIAARSNLAIFAVALFLAAFAPSAPRAFAQTNMPHIDTVDPASGKVSDTITLTGTHLGKGSVAGIFLSDDKSDYKAAVVSQADEKIEFRVPQVKPGGYNVSVQSNGQILILPVRFTVEE